MSLRMKMMISFSIIMLVALIILTQYGISSSLEGSSATTRIRFANMSASVAKDLDLDIEMMEMAAKELEDDVYFVSALNQFVRDDSEEQGMAAYAKRTALNTLCQSHLVDQYYRVNFVGLNGSYITSNAIHDPAAVLSPDEVLSTIDQLMKRTESEGSANCMILPPHTDFLDQKHNITVYGIVRPIYHQKKMLGYLTIIDEYKDLNRLTSYLDEPEQIEIQVSFDNGTLFYSNTDHFNRYPTDMEEGQLTQWKDEKNKVDMEVCYYKLASRGLNIYVAQDTKTMSMLTNMLRQGFIRRGVLIMLAAFLLIFHSSFTLTKSIRRLSNKVKQVSTDRILLSDKKEFDKLSEPVTSTYDREIHALETTYDATMARLRSSMQNELSLRESTLQAQLEALQTQINPHFIYNTLNIISANALENGNFEIINIVDQFASMLRYSTDTRSRTATLQDELENVTNYLSLQKARYEDHLEYSIDVPSELGSILVPKLTLQPLAENALKHGFDGINVVRKLQIRGSIAASDSVESGVTSSAGRVLTLEIRDNGTGFSDEILPNLLQRIDDINEDKVSVDEERTGGIGLLNTCLRLHYYSDRKAHINIKNDGGAVITLTLPLGADA